MAIGREKAIFLNALEFETDSKQRAYLDDACGSDAALRAAVDELLTAHGRSTAFLDMLPDPCVQLRRQLHHAIAVTEGSHCVSGPPDDDANLADREGDTIGNYRLIQRIGEGGFGQVYVAEQQQPVRRPVALKLLKPGMGSRRSLPVSKPSGRHWR